MPPNRIYSSASPLPPIKPKKKIRPSSAAGNIQTHHSYTTGLFRDVLRPSTAATVRDSTSTGAVATTVARPHTQAGGPRPLSRWKSFDRNPEELIVRHPRRLTLGTVDGIAGLDHIKRPVQALSEDAVPFKIKVNDVC